MANLFGELKRRNVVRVGIAYVVLGWVALQLANWLISRDENDLSINFIVNQIMGNPREAHQLLIDAELDIQALRSFLGYPFFNHTYFPELVKILEQQGIDRHFVHGPPYRCEAQPTK